MSPEHKGTRRWLLTTASATAGAAGLVALCPKDAWADGPDKSEVEPEFEIESPPEERLFEPLAVQKPRIYTEQEVEVIIDTKADELGLPKDKAKEIAWCESKNNQYAKNKSGASGIFQIVPTTWQNILNKFLPTRQDMDIWDAEDNVEAALTLWKMDGSGHWSQCGG